MRQTLAITTVAALLIGCSRPPPDYDLSLTAALAGATQEPDVGVYRDTLVSSFLFGQSDDLGVVVDLVPLQRWLVVSRSTIAPYFLVYDRNRRVLRDRFGMHGETPGKFLGGNRMASGTGRSEDIVIYGTISGRLTPARITDEPAFFLGTETSLNLDRRLYDISMANGMFAATMQTPDLRLEVGSFSEGTTESVDTLGPFDGSQVRYGNHRRNLNQSEVAMDPSGSRFAVAFRRAHRVDFFETSGTRYASVSVAPPVRVRFVTRGDYLVWHAQSGIGYVDVVATVDYVFAAFGGPPEGHDVGERHYAHVVEVFDWTGALVGELALDHDIYLLAVSDDGRLFGAIWEGGEVRSSTISEWRLPVLNRSEQ